MNTVYNWEQAQVLLHEGEILECVETNNVACKQAPVPNMGRQALCHGYYRIHDKRVKYCLLRDNPYSPNTAWLTSQVSLTNLMHGKFKIASETFDIEEARKQLLLGNRVRPTGWDTSGGGYLTFDRKTMRVVDDVGIPYTLNKQTFQQSKWRLV